MGIKKGPGFQCAICHQRLHAIYLQLDHLNMIDPEPGPICDGCFLSEWERKWQFAARAYGTSASRAPRVWDWARKYHFRRI